MSDPIPSASSSSSSHPNLPDHARRRYEEAIKGEIVRLEKEYPTPNEVPGCMTLLYVHGYLMNDGMGIDGMLKLSLLFLLVFQCAFLWRYIN